MKKKMIFFTVLFFLLSLASVFAVEQEYYAGESYTLRQSDTVEGDIMIFAGNVRIYGEVKGSAHIVGSNVKITGDVSKDVYIIGGDVEIGGNVSGMTNVLGGNIDLSGTFGGKLNTAGATVELVGTFSGPVNAAAADIIASGEFLENVKLVSENLTLSSGASFAKDLSIKAKESTIEEDVVISGKLNEITGEEALEKAREASGAGIAAALIFWFITLVGIIIVGLVLHALFPAFVKEVTSSVYKDVIWNLGMGVLVLLLTPLAILILCATVVGIPLGLLLSIAYGVGLYLGKLFVAAATGAFLFSYYGKKKREAPFWLSLVVGVLIVYLLLLIPILDVFIALIVYILGLGTLFHYINTHRTQRAKQKKKKAPAKKRAPKKK
jgi:cytoskeletal protein CcmA (bactofilin family)